MEAAQILLILLLLSSGSGSAMAREPVRLIAGVDMGYRQDDLAWNISDTDNSPNILSELVWSDLQIVQARVSATARLFRRWEVSGYGIYGEVLSGDNRDSDYDGDDRTLEFMRSENEAGGDVSDLSISLGYRFRFTDQSVGKDLWLKPMVGYSYHKQRLRMFNGRSVLPSPSVIDGLNSSYDTQWKGKWWGVAALFEADARLHFEVFVEYHDNISYYAEADWNLRSDFAHPVSFVHRAEGQGRVGGLNLVYALSRSLSLTLAVERRLWDTTRNDQSTDTTFFTDGSALTTPLNEVRWDSTSLFLGFTYRLWPGH